MSGDWIKLHRKLLKSAVATDPIVCHVWVHLLLRANWERRQLLNGVWLEPGEVYFGQEKLAAEIGVTRKQLRRAISALIAHESCAIRAKGRAKRGTHLSICHWQTYQSQNGGEGQKKGHKRARRGPEEGQKRAIEEERKKERTKEEEGSSSNFEKFWLSFSAVRRTKKAEAAEAWAEMGCEAIAETVIAAAVDYAASDEGRSEYCQGPAPWLKAARWEDARKSWGTRRTRTPLDKRQADENLRYAIVRAGRRQGLTDDDIRDKLKTHGLTW